MLDLKTLRIEKKLSQTDICELLNIKQPYASALENGTRPISKKHIEIFRSKFGADLNKYIIETEPTGKSKKPSLKHKANIIPFFRDISLVTSNQKEDPIAGYIDVGTLFTDATAAMRYYGNNIVEYPSGCILLLREVSNKCIIHWGSIYMVEFTGLRVIARLQRGSDNNIIGHSTNKDSYIDGKPIYEPIEMPIDKIQRYYLVLGYVVKQSITNSRTTT